MLVSLIVAPLIKSLSSSFTAEFRNIKICHHKICRYSHRSHCLICRHSPRVWACKARCRYVQGHLIQTVTITTFQGAAPMHKNVSASQGIHRTKGSGRHGPPRGGPSTRDHMPSLHGVVKEVPEPTNASKTKSACDSPFRYLRLETLEALGTYPSR